MSFFGIIGRKNEFSRHLYLNLSYSRRIFESSEGVWPIDVSAVFFHPFSTEKDWSGLISAFHPAEQARISRFAREEDRLRKAASHMLLAIMLGEKLGAGYRELIFRRGGYGKPYLDRDQAPQFNVSASGALVVCAVAQAEVGIDVERVAPFEASAMRLLLGHSESEGPAGSSEQEELEAFYERWTLLESWLKAEGTGLHDEYPLAAFAPKPIAPKRFHMEARQPGTVPWILTSSNVAPSVPEQYALAVCRRPEENWTEEVLLLDGEELAKRFRALLSRDARYAEGENNKR